MTVPAWIIVLVAIASATGLLAFCCMLVEMVIKWLSPGRHDCGCQPDPGMDARVSALEGHVDTLLDTLPSIDNSIKSVSVNASTAFKDMAEISATVRSLSGTLSAIGRAKGALPPQTPSVVAVDFSDVETRLALLAGQVDKAADVAEKAHSEQVGTLLKASGKGRRKDRFRSLKGKSFEEALNEGGS